MEWTVVVVVAAAIATYLLLRGPLAELRQRRRERERKRKREWRRQRDAERARRRAERAMNPVRAAARRGPPRWQQVARRQSGKCWLCGGRTFPGDRRRTGTGAEQLGAAYPTVDYVLPVDRGGTLVMDNLRIAHRHCAQLRRDNPSRVEYGVPRRTYAD